MRRWTVILLLTMLLLSGALYAGWTLVYRPAIHQATKSSPKYIVALGDSVTAGDGLPLAVMSGNAAACARSSDAYPAILANSTHIKLAQFACSGATTTAGLLGPQTVDGQTVPAQLSSAKPYIKGNDVVLTIGANDVNWGSMLTDCATSDCMTSANLSTFNQQLSLLQQHIGEAFQTIHAAHPHAVVVNTYYSLVTPSDTCLARYNISSATIAWVNAREATLNSALTAAAKKIGAHVVHINFTGHMLCSSDSWIQTETDNAPLHPTAAGQQAIARQDARYL